MARAANQKLKILYILKLLERSDETHAVTMKEILGELSAHGIQAERKRIYDDLEALRRFGYPIVAKRGRMAGYYLAAEGREDLLSAGARDQAGKEETVTEAEALAAGQKGDMEGEAPDAAGDGVRHGKTAVWEEPGRLLSGDTKVELCCGDEMAEKIVKKLGGSSPVRVKAGKKPGTTVLKLKVNAGGEFYGWLAGFGCRVRIVGPPAVIKEYRRYLKEIRNLYKTE